MEKYNSNPSLAAGLRKGAWTKEEDDLLRECIAKYGEGKWHQVPLRAGLNRCRKSCRLRWLNYLRPNIKRGCFSKDEIDLILRLHKLLGNRWSLIAGRIPGRTANDVKNFWNTLIGKKANNNNNHNNNILGEGTSNNKIMDHSGGGAVIIKDQVIKPQPRAFLFKRPHHHHHHDHHAPPPISTNNNNNLMGSANQISSTRPACNFLVETSSQQQQQMPQDESIRWWTSLLDEAAMDDDPIRSHHHQHHYSHHHHEDDDDDDELVLDKMLWSGPYGNNGGNKSTGDIMNNVDDHDADIWGGIIGGL